MYSHNGAISCMTCICTALGLSFASGSGDHASMQNGEALRRFQAEALPAWQEYEQRAARSVATISVRWESGPSASVSETAGKCQTFDNWQLISYKESGDDVAYGINSRYAFEVRRRRGTAGWTATAWSELASAEEVIPLRRLADVKLVTTLPVRLERVPLSVITRKPEFKIVECTEIEQDGDALVQVVFDYTHEARLYEGYLPDCVQKGVLVLDPSRYWSLRRYEVEIKEGDYPVFARMTASDLSVDRRALPAARTIRVVTESQKIGRSIRQSGGWDVTLTEVGHIDEEEFTLSAFGLPEPWDLQQAAKKPTRWFLWLTLAGVAFLAVGAFFYYRARRRA